MNNTSIKSNFSSTFSKESILEFKDLKEAIIEKTSNAILAGKTIFSIITPCVLKSPYHIYKSKNMRIITSIASSFLVISSMDPYRPYKINDRIFNIIFMTPVALDQWGIKPTETTSCISLEVILILGTIWQSISIIEAGFNSINNNILTNLIIPLIALAALFDAVKGGIELAKGVKILNSLEDEQKKAVLRNGATRNLSPKKHLNALVVNGLSHTQKIIDNTNDPFEKFLYETCNTRSCSVTNEYELNNSLLKACDKFNSKIDIICFIAHGNTFEIELNEDYAFCATKLELRSLKKHISENGKIFLMACNTATTPDNPLAMCLAKRISRFLPNCSVQGFKTFYNPFFTIVDRKNNDFFLANLFPFNDNGITSLKTSVILKKTC